MTREDYDRYVAAFNTRDYDAVFDFYAENPRMAFFGIEITTRDQLKAFYGFMHRYVNETVTGERFAGSHELAAVEAIVRIEATDDLTREVLDGRGDALVRGGERDADVPGAGRPVELAGPDEDAERRQMRDGLPARLVPRRPQVQRRLGMVDAEPVPLERGAQAGAAPRVPGALLVGVHVVVERRDHRRLHRRRDDHPRMLADLQQPLDDLQDDDVPEAVEPLRPRTVGGAHARLDQPGAGPVVQLAVGDAGRRARRGTPVADQLGLGRGALAGVRRPMRGAGHRPADRIRTACGRPVAGASHADLRPFTSRRARTIRRPPLSRRTAQDRPGPFHSTVGSHSECVNDRHTRHAE